MDFLFKETPNVFESMVREFAHSFRLEWRLVKDSESKLGVEERYIVSWNFRLEGRDFSVGSDDLRTAFGVRDDLTSYPYGPLETKKELWRYITKIDEDFMPSQLALKIREPFWKGISSSNCNLHLPSP